jgi:hypothetical protein
VLGNVTDLVSTSGVRHITEYRSDDVDNKMIKTVSGYLGGRYLITKKYVSITNGLELKELNFYISPDKTEDNATHCLLIKFDVPIILLNSSKMPYDKYNYSYKLTYLQRQQTDNALFAFVPVMLPISNAETCEFKRFVSDGKEYIRWNLTSNTEANKANLPVNEFILQTDIEIDPGHLKRDFVKSDPLECRTYFHFKMDDGTAFSSTHLSSIHITQTGSPTDTSPTPAPSPGPSPTAPTPTPTSPTPSPAESAPYWVLENGVCIMNGFAGVQTNTYSSLQACLDAGGT